MRVQRLGVLVVQRAKQLGVVVADGGLLALDASPAMRSPRNTYGDPDRFSPRSGGPPTDRSDRCVHVWFMFRPTLAHHVLLASGA
ncbi:hypothetical protein D7147_03230 [Micromonospora musae]|uniref:Uncharacterized protein n=1 Tax=Micromonospora musae TaxID=1894970 RepID=A0A3A9Y1H6_9ACTN|nr:hypothetical protein D7147_03230 [Micromonospora musae]RKN31650.1 hypothetical protein D7044_15170 [Micromonospora musae]